MSRDDVIKTLEIFNNLWTLLPWHARKLKANDEDRVANSLADKNLKKFLSLRAGSNWQDQNRLEWKPIEDSERLRESFIRLRDAFYVWNLKSKPGPGRPPRLMWESGNITGHRPYFYLQAWNEMGYLFEMTQRGWVISRAEKIVNLDRFMRLLNAWDHVVLYEAGEWNGPLRVKCEQWGEDLVSLSLYEDAMIRMFTDLFPAESLAKRRIDT